MRPSLPGPSSGLADESRRQREAAPDCVVWKSSPKTGARSNSTRDVRKNPLLRIFRTISPLFSTPEQSENQLFLTSAFWTELTRITRLTAATDYAVYTPGGSAGLPVSVLRSFAPPPHCVLFSKSPGCSNSIFPGSEGLLPLFDLASRNISSTEPESQSHCHGNGAKKHSKSDFDDLIGQSHLSQRNGAGKDDD